MASGYTICPCCGDTTVSEDDAKPELCEICIEAGCEAGEECSVIEVSDAELRRLGHPHYQKDQPNN